MSVTTSEKKWPDELAGLSVHLVGAKGTGMCALAEILVAAGAVVTGSDVDEVFYTDAILKDLGVPVSSFDAVSLEDASFLVRSAAYDVGNPVVDEARRRVLPEFTYPEALGAISRGFDSTGIAGVHGKTTTTALAGSLLQALECPATVVVGSAVSGFGDRSTWTGGQRYLVAETCEYRRHFLHFSPRRIVITSIESDHQDYYPDYDSIRKAFDEYIDSLPQGGELIYCADDKGASEAAGAARTSRPDIIYTPYGESAEGPWKLTHASSDKSSATPGENHFRIAGLARDFHLKVPGRHIVLDAVAALALVWSIEQDRKKTSELQITVDSTVPVRGSNLTAGKGVFADVAAEALAIFRGSRRRSEIIGEAGGILFMDDYAHHPTAIAATLDGLKEFHPQRRLVVDFQAHTYSRTAALFDEFADCFGSADLLLLQPIYASARELYDGTITGETLRDAVAARRDGQPTIYCESLDIAADKLLSILQPDDLFITLGAGNNRPLVQRLFTGMAENEKTQEN